MFGIVAAKIAGVDHDAANDAGKAQANDAPIEAGGTPPPALPAVHPFAAVGVLAFDKDGRGCL